MSKYTEENPFNLTSKQLAFCEAYLFHEDCRFNGTASAKLAGYSEKGARTTAAQTLAKANITKHLKYLEDKFKNELQKRTPADMAQVLDDIIMKQYGMEYSPVNIIAALELQAKLEGKLSKQKVEISGKDGEPIEISEVTRMVMMMPGERPVPEFPPGYEPGTPNATSSPKPEVKKEVTADIKQPEKKTNATKNIILQTLISKGVKS